MDHEQDWETQRLRQMSAEEKVRVSHLLWHQAWEAAAAGVRARHPDWSEGQVVNGVRELMRAAGS